MIENVKQRVTHSGRFFVFAMHLSVRGLFPPKFF